MIWKKGRGKLGIFEPLLGTWIANKGSTERTNPACAKVFTKILGGKYIRMEATWFLGDKTYDDLTLLGSNADKELCFWSFTSDGKQATGKLADVSDLHPEAVGFAAHMPSGFARQAYWPDDGEGIHWVVESQTKKGWNRIVHHHYLPD